MVAVSSKTPDCSIARALDIVGERWSLVIVRELLLGNSRFAIIRDRLGLAPDVLSSRLGTLLEHGVVRRSPYVDDAGRTRDEYLLTDAGRDLAPVVTALSQWGDDHNPGATRTSTRIVDQVTGEHVRVAMLTDAGAEVSPRGVILRKASPAA